MDYKGYALVTILLASVASVALIGTAHAQQSVTLQTDKPSYVTGDSVKITGQVGPVKEGEPVLILVTDPDGNFVRTDQVPAASIAADGSYNYTFPAAGKYWLKDGTYTVKATYNRVSKEATLMFDSTEIAWKKFPLKIADQTYNIEYMITNGTVTNMTGDPALATLTVTISSTSEGNLKIRLPRNVMQALSVEGVQTGGTDVAYEVFIDTTSGTAVDETGPANTRQLSIDFDQGSAEIEIVGTWLVPEFGAIAAIVLVVAIVGIIAATARYGKLNSSFLPRP
jgi:predicted secreted protein with PEFG-CTERM motif